MRVGIVRQVRGDFIGTDSMQVPSSRGTPDQRNGHPDHEGCSVLTFIDQAAGIVSGHPSKNQTCSQVAEAGRSFVAGCASHHHESCTKHDGVYCSAGVRHGNLDSCFVELQCRAISCRTHTLCHEAGTAYTIPNSQNSCRQAATLLRCNCCMSVLIHFDLRPPLDRFVVDFAG